MLNPGEVNPVEIIRKKRDGEELAPEEIRWMIAEFTQGRVGDYQMSALAMAIYFQGMTTSETAALTDAMTSSGALLAWGDGPPLVDKHSTGGVGDKISLVLAPLLASCGLRVPMISGRGLGTTGGTLDKLESIPGFRTDLGMSELQQQTESIGCAISGASEEIAPADRKLYALRDVTATVASIPLITASIMSKKLAEGLDQLVLDVKCGDGAFMKTQDQARKLARSLVETGRRNSVQTTAVITDMNQPVGRMVGNVVEVDEAIRVLQGEVIDDVLELVYALGTPVLHNSGQARDVADAQAQLSRSISSGAAYEKFCEMVRCQHGDLDALPTVVHVRDVQISQDGFVEEIDAEAIGSVIIDLGGGRKAITDQVDHRPGIEILVKVGDPVDRRQPWARLYNIDDPATAERMSVRLADVIAIADSAPQTASSAVLETIPG
jgi:pyrimidine-nucleoside phosphorylase